MRAALYRGGVVVSALLLGGFFGFFAYGLGLFLPAPVSVALGSLTTAVFSALGAGWGANALSPDGARTRLLAVLFRCLVGGVLAAVIDVAGVLLSEDVGAGAALVALTWLLLGLLASLSAWALRAVGRPLRRDALVTLAIVLGAILFVVGSVAVTCAITPCIA